MTAARHHHGTMISVEGVRQNNLKNFSLQIPVGRLIAVCGVSGSGKSSFAVETLCAEGQRRYIETFSPYARQFMDRIGKPDVEAVRDVPPAVSIYQGNPIKTSRSTVATMSELADFIKALFARSARVVCGSCGRDVTAESTEDVAKTVLGTLEGATALITFPVRLARGFKPAEVLAFLKNQGFNRLVRENRIVQATSRSVSARSGVIEIVMDRVTVDRRNESRIIESVTGGMKFGQGRVDVIPLEEGKRIDAGRRLKFSNTLHCPYCDVQYPDPDPAFFSYNSPLGACSACRGFGNIINIDRGKVVPDERKALRDGAIRPWKTGYSAECYDDLRRFCKREGIPLDVPWEQLDDEAKKLIWEGKGSWYGIRGYFDYIESKSYKMHFRVLMARYRSYLRCPDCGGRRFRPDVLVYRVGDKNISQVHAMSVRDALAFGRSIRARFECDAAALMVVDEMTRRLETMERVGLGYLTLDRESRTLSGGEVGRLRLASALGANLTNTLYVLDEPTVGLHPRDIDRLLDVLRELKDRGNTVVVVEHDLRVLAAADAIIDLGPGPGARGGQVVYYGPPLAPVPAGKSVTLSYLRGEEAVGKPASRRLWDRKYSLKVLDAGLRNLKGINADIPLNLFVCVTGVSGSGKSSLVHDVLGESLRRFLDGKDYHPTGCARIEGWASLDEVIIVDQSPAATTPRANPATYTGLIKHLRALMAGSPLARKRGYGPSMFSFNSGQGRCSRCGGTGYEKIEMQFLSDLYIKCQQCDGKRFRKEVLEVTFEGKNIHDILSMTIDEACEFLSEDTAGKAGALEAMKRVGLGYLALGQPFTTLSSGEIQRLKLAGIVAGKRRRARRLILMDEPTTGLHASDIRNFVGLVQDLVEAGDSVVVIEHNMDVVRESDWVIDLGPEGGEGGGRVVAAGRPEDILDFPESRTAPYLREALEARAGRRAAAAREHAGEVRYEKGSRAGAGGEDWAQGAIRIVGARHNNLRGIDVSIPLEKITLVTGVSGSGKSSLAFDVLFAEGQRRYLDSVSPYVRQYLKQVPHPDVDYISMLPPTVAIEQRSSRGGVRSTVGTLTEIHPFLRLLFARTGTRLCPDCRVPVRPQNVESMVDEIVERPEGAAMDILVPVIRGRKGKHADALRAMARKGLRKARVDGRVLPLEKVPELSRYREHFIDAVIGEVVPGKSTRADVDAVVRRAVAEGKGVFAASVRGRKRVGRSGGGDRIFSTLNRCPSCSRGFDDLDPRNFSFNSFMGACPVCRGLGRAGVEEEEDFYEEAGIERDEVCPSCGGKRLKEEFLHVLVGNRSIADLCALSIERTLQELKGMRFEGRDAMVAGPIMDEVASRLGFLMKAGVGYLSLDRSSNTLSAGESQRVKLAASLGSELRGVCYVLDEPTIGLHPSDNRMIREVFRELRDKQNSIVVVEHDEETIRSADFCIELGPGGGREGGEVIAQGPPEYLAGRQDCPTGLALARPPDHPMRGEYRPGAERTITIRGARAHNLKNLDVTVPLGRLVCLTGVSGSGKSSLLENVLFEGYRRHGGRKRRAWPDCDAIEGLESIKSMKYVDQTPIGKTPRSTVSTYVGFMTEIRKLFALTPEARMRGLGPSRFSFNVKGGRCEECQGQGLKKAQMTFLPLVRVVCEKCGGRRYTDEVLKITYRDRSIADVLDMTVSEAVEFFAFHRKILSALTILEETGLGYLLLGQASPTLSGGEAQRIKLAAEMSGLSSVRDTVYLLEEPTTGLHTWDVRKILSTFHRLVDAGATVVVIEHNLDVIAEADWIIDLGPGGGESGGEVTAMGTVGDLVADPGRSRTAEYLRKRLRQAPRAGLAAPSLPHANS